MTDEELRAVYMAGAPGALAWPWPKGLRAVLDKFGAPALVVPAGWALVAAGLAFSAPTLAEWAEKWCKGKYKAYGFTSLLEGVMIFSVNNYLALAGLAILVAINCNSAWRLAGKKV